MPFSSASTVPSTTRVSQERISPDSEISLPTSRRLWSAGSLARAWLAAGWADWVDAFAAAD